MALTTYITVNVDDLKVILDYVDKPDWPVYQRLRAKIDKLITIEDMKKALHCESCNGPCRDES